MITAAGKFSARSKRLISSCLYYNLSETTFKVRMMRWPLQTTMHRWIFLGFAFFILTAESISLPNVTTTSKMEEQTEIEDGHPFPSSFVPTSGVTPAPTLGIALDLTRPRAIKPGTEKTDTPGEDGTHRRTSTVEIVIVSTIIAVALLFTVVFFVRQRIISRRNKRESSDPEEEIELKCAPDGVRRPPLPDRIVNSTLLHNNSESSLEVCIDGTSPLLTKAENDNLQNNELSKEGSRPNIVNVWPPAPPEPKPVTRPKAATSNLYIHQFSRHFDQDGGKLSFLQSDVEVVVPRGAVPKNLNGQMEVEARVVVPGVNLNLAAAAEKRCTEHDFQLSPAVEMMAKGLAKFDKPVTIRIPHCARIDKGDWSFRVQCSESEVGSQMRWKDIPPESKDNNSAVVDCCYSYDARYFYVKTTHFTTFVVTGCCQERRLLDLECVVFGQYVERGKEQEVIFRVYLCDTIVDYRQSLKSDEGQNGGREVCMPRPLSLADEKSDITVTLLDDVKHSESHWPWTVDSLHGRQTRQQSIKVQNCIKCVKCCPARRAPFAQFICKPRDPAKRQSHIVASFEVGKRRKRTEADDTQTLIMSVRDFELVKQTAKDSTSLASQDLDLAGIADLIPRNCLKSLARRLKLTEVNIQEIEHDFPNDAREQAIQVLLAWKQQQGSSATPDKLLRSMRSCGLNGVADEIRHTCLLDCTRVSVV